MKRKIVKIDPEKCNGCGLCVPNCAEGAIQIINGKARLVADNLCDGLGACLGECPEGAITIEEREAVSFDEKVVKKHLQTIGQEPAPRQGPHDGGLVCPASRAITHQRAPSADTAPAGATRSELGHWPVKLQLVPPTAPFFRGKNLLIAADCAPVAFGDFQQMFLKESSVVIQCPKFGEQDFVIDKLAGIFKDGGITGVTVLRLEVPCCGGLSWAVQKALQASGRKDLPLREVIVGVKGDLIADRHVTTGIPVHG